MIMPFVFGSTGRMKELARHIDSMAQSGVPVLIEGESGTGKAALAEHLHSLSGLPGEFTPFFCGLSGTEEGGAALRRGFRAAGCLFLKHVQLLPPALQQQLLSDLEHQEGPRLISSSPEPLEARVHRKQFSASLYYRLSAYRISLPALRERKADLPELFSSMVARLGAPAARLPARALDALSGYAWPGNLRELENVARLFVLAGSAEELLRELERRQSELEMLRGENKAPVPLKEQVKRASKKLESEIILRTLERHRWNRRRAAQSLQISYRSLLYKMKNCEIRFESEAQPERMA
jgi:DNA-binding NtrC family response regulator